MNQQSKMLWWVAGGAAIAILIYVLTGGQQAAQPGGKEQAAKGPVKVGFIGPLTGDVVSLGQDAQMAVQMAVEEINVAGGIGGRPLEVIYEDGQCTGKIASNAANKLINVDKVSVILGGLCSGETSSFAPAAEQAKVVTLSYCSSAPAISDAGEYIFRDYPSDSFQGVYGAEYAYNTLGKKKAAVLYVKNAWGEGIKNVFVAKFKELGGEVALEEGYDQSHRDLRAQLTKVKASNPDLVYFAGYTEASIPALKQAKELGIKTQLLGADGWDDPKLWTEAGSAGEGAQYTVVAAAAADEFKQKAKERSGREDVTVCAPFAYDAAKLIAQVIGKVGDNSEDIKNELYKTEYTGGVSSGTIKFDSNGDLIGANYIIKSVKGGAAQEMK